MARSEFDRFDKHWTRDPGVLRKRGLTASEVAERYEEDVQAGMTEDQLQVRYGTRRQQALLTSGAPQAAGYSERSRPLLTDGRGWGFPPHGPADPTRADVYKEINETRARHAAGQYELEFPQPGDTVTLGRIIPVRGQRSAMDERQAVTLVVAHLFQAEERRASALIEFTSAMPQRDEIETTGERSRRDAQMTRQLDRLDADLDGY